MHKYSKSAEDVLTKRYLTKGPDGKPIEDIDGLWSRVANALYDDDPKKAEEAKVIFENGDFIPNSPTLFNAGKPNGQLSACFVLPIEDSMEGIFETLKQTALIHKSGGGTGFNFSRIRSKGSRVASTGGVASGVISFLTVYDAATESVKQGGTRRGANMGMLRVDHPEIMDFILCKDDTSKLHNFNLSVAVTDKFMEAVEEGTTYQLVEPSTGEIVEEKDAREVWNLIVHQAWKNGEPGVIFIDEINRHNPNPELGEIEATNPCGEQPLLPYESCNLGSINLSHCVGYDGPDIPYFDWDKLKELVVFGTETLNRVLDRNCFPNEKIKEQTLRTRKIGLGIMGWADCLLKLGIAYDSIEARMLATDIMQIIRDWAHAYSEEHDYNNSTLTTIAPTGTIAIIADASSGIEPNFAWAYKRNCMDEMMTVVNEVMADILKKRNLYNEEMLEKLASGTPLTDIPELADLAPVFQLSHEISPEDHVQMQAAWQEFTDNAVSKTINLPNSATEQDVAYIYMLAYKLGCKGTTVYRDGSRSGQVLNFDKKEEKPENMADISNAKPKTRSKRMVGATTSQKIGCGHLFVTVNHDEDGDISEVFTTTGKYGGCPAQSTAMARVISIALRNGVGVDVIIDQLKGIQCKNCVHKEGLDGTSCPDAVARVIEDEWKRLQDGGDICKCHEKYEEPAEQPASESKCPVCGAKLQMMEGCMTCLSCGKYSKCS